ncbi:MAG TPA: xanthine dehydrogenase family protein subunit M [Candidatus Limnocylindrales bacterium]|nr:xanthine dehydrogenase family protein subunit M [Candidatus Limnocylindrales bacterium]
MNPFSYTRPRALGDALKLLKTGRTALAGGTDLITLVRHGIARPDALVDLTGIDGLRGIVREKGQGIRIGALTALADVEGSADIGRLLPIVVQSLRDAATPQIRNAGTVGGNLLQRNRCWYFRDEGVICWLKGGTRCFAVDGENRYHAVAGAHECWMVSPSDLAPALIACDAEIEIASSVGKRRMRLAELFVAPHGRERREHALRAGELITAVRIPEKSLERRGTYLKAMERKAWSFAIVSVAATARLSSKDGKASDARLVLGGIAPVPWRVPAAEKLLEGSTLDDNTCLAAADALLESAEPLRDNGYKITLARELVRRALRSLRDA